MKGFYDIFNKKFPTSQKAVSHCQSLARLCGFSVRIRTSKLTTIYIVCSKEGLPESKLEGSKKRNRNSDRCNCDWKVVLYKTKQGNWEFRAGKAMEHNHLIFNKEDFNDGTPSEPCQKLHRTSSATIQKRSLSPLPCLKSLGLPNPSDGLITPSDSMTSSYSTSPSSIKASYISQFPFESLNFKWKSLEDLPPLTDLLSKIMPSEQPIPKTSTAHSLSFLMN